MLGNEEYVLSIAMAVSIGLVLIVNIFLKMQIIEEVFREQIRNIKDAKKRKATLDNLSNKNELEMKLNRMLGKVSQNVVKSEKLAKVTGKSIPTTAKIGKSIVTTISNPYNNTNAVKMFMLVIIFCCSGVISSTLLKNPAMGLATFIMGLIMPFTLVTIGGLKRKLHVMKGNLHFLSVHLPNYLDSSTYEESLRRSLKSMTPGTMQYRAVQNCLSNMIELNMTKMDAIKRLKEELLAEKYVTEYFEVTEKAETFGKEYKNILASIIKNFEELVINNEKVVTFSYWAYILYIGAVIGMIFVVGLLKKSDPETYLYLSTTVPGQAVIFVVFMLAIIIGIVMSGASDLINLEIYKKAEADILKEDIYV